MLLPTGLAAIAHVFLSLLRPGAADQLWRDAPLLGQTVSPDEAYNALKGLRSAAARLAMHTATPPKSWPG